METGIKIKGINFRCLFKTVPHL